MRGWREGPAPSPALTLPEALLPRGGGLPVGQVPSLPLAQGNGFQSLYQLQEAARKGSKCWHPGLHPNHITRQVTEPLFKMRVAAPTTSGYGEK